MNSSSPQHAKAAVPANKVSAIDWVKGYLGRNAQDKMPRITLLFWALKIVATTLGETLGDVASMTADLGYSSSSAIFFSILLVLLIVQLVVYKFYPIVYWLLILATSTAGTTLSDFMDRTLELGYLYGSLILIGLLLITLGIWFAMERTLSVTKVQSRRAEFMYWIAILISNTLGTAFGDLLADSEDIGYATAAGIIFGVIGADVLLFLLSRRIWPFTLIPRVPLFWVAFVATRPLGATVGDLFTKDEEKGGVEFGTVNSSIVLGVILLVLIAFQTFFSDRVSAWYHVKFADTIERFKDLGKRMDDGSTRTADIQKRAALEAEVSAMAEAVAAPLSAAEAVTISQMEEAHTERQATLSDMETDDSEDEEKEVEEEAKPPVSETKREGEKKKKRRRRRREE